MKRNHLKEGSSGKEESVKILAKDLKQEQKERKVTVGAVYQKLPMTISLEAHQDRFEQFLQFVQHSGDIEEYYFKGQPVPIMSVESLNLPLEEVDVDELVQSYSIKMNFYFQK